MLAAKPNDALSAIYSGAVAAVFIGLEAQMTLKNGLNQTKNTFVEPKTRYEGAASASGNKFGK